MDSAYYSKYSSNKGPVAQFILLAANYKRRGNKDTRSLSSLKERFCLAYNCYSKICWIRTQSSFFALCSFAYSIRHLA